MKRWILNILLVVSLFYITDTNIENKINQKVSADIKMSYVYDNQLTQNQNALKLVAEQYYNRGQYIQYDDYRKAVGDYSPELATEDNTLYVVCGAFIYDVYRVTYNVRDNLIVNNGLSSTERISTFARNNKNNSAYKPYIVYAEFSDTYRTDFQNFILNYEKNLQVGDVVAYLHTSTEGHTMLYIGNGEFIHAGGNNYNLSNKTDRIEGSNTAIRKSRISEMYANKELIFENRTFTSFVVLRPLQNNNLQITSNTAARMNLGNLVMNKVSSIGTKVSVNKGDQIKYTITVTNQNAETKVINVNDVVPTNSVFLSCNSCTIAGQEIHWYNVSVPSGSKVTFQYTVQVSNTNGEVNSSKTNISGFVINTIRHQIKPTLSTSKQNTLANAIKTTKPSNGNSLKKIYSSVGINIDWMGDISDQVINSMFSQIQITTSPTYTTLVNDYYGGRYFSSPIESTSRDNLYPGKDVTFKNLAIGDMLLVSSFNQIQAAYPYRLSAINGSVQNKIYIYVGNNTLYDYNTATLLTQSTSQAILTSLLGEYKYMVLRPSYNGITSSTTTVTPNNQNQSNGNSKNTGNVENNQNSNDVVKDAGTNTINSESNEESNDTQQSSDNNTQNSENTSSSNSTNKSELNIENTDNSTNEEQTIENPNTSSSFLKNSDIIVVIILIVIFITYLVYTQKFER